MLDIPEHVDPLPQSVEWTPLPQIGLAQLEPIRLAQLRPFYPSPIEIQIWPDKIEILSFPGPVPPVDAQKLKQQKRIIAREYRNRRMDDFLKELHLTEGRGTGFPTIYKAMSNNGSPDPVFETDEQCTYFLTTLPAVVTNQVSNQAGNQVKALVLNDLESIVAFTNQVSDQVSVQVSDQVSVQVSEIISNHIGKLAGDVLMTIRKGPKSKRSILDELGLTNHISNKQRHIDPLLAIGWMEYTNPENPKDRNQKYRLTPAGLKLITLMRR